MTSAGAMNRFAPTKVTKFKVCDCKINSQEEVRKTIHGCKRKGMHAEVRVSVLCLVVLLKTGQNVPNWVFVPFVHTRV